MREQNQTPPGVPEHFLYKSRLQQYVQKLSLPFPVYGTYNEGVPHAPLFRATVLVDNTCYTSRNLFTNIKSAEQDIAKIALEDLLQKINDEGSRFIHEDTVFCKAVLNEYATKMHLDLPIYRTTLQQGVLPTFWSSLVFNGVTFTGQVARSKKEAEQLAARAVILSIMGHPGPDSATISNIIKSKYRPLAALYNANASNNLPNVTPMLTNGGPISGSSLNNGNEIVNLEATNNVFNVAIIEDRSNQVATNPVPSQPFHEFKKPKLDTPTAPVTPPITFVPSVHEQGPGAGPTSAKKRRKKGNKNHQFIARPVVPSGGVLLGKENGDTGATGNPSSTTLGEKSSRQDPFVRIVNQPFQEVEKPMMETSPSEAIPPSNPGLDSTIISNIVKSKYRPLAALYNANGSNNTPNVVMPMLTNGELTSGSSLNKGNEIVNLNASNNVLDVKIIEDLPNQIATNPVPSQPFHEFKKPKLDTPPASVTPITFVPPVHEQGPVVGPTSAKKRRKRGNKNHQSIAQPVVPGGGVISGPSLNKGKENEDTGATGNPSSTGLGEKPLRQAAFIRIVNQPFCEVEKPKIETSPSEAIPPCMFVPPVLEQPLGAGPSATEKHRKKGKKSHQPVALFSYPVDSTSQIPCSISR